MVVGMEGHGKSLARAGGGTRWRRCRVVPRSPRISSADVATKHRLVSSSFDTTTGVAPIPGPLQQTANYLAWYAPTPIPTARRANGHLPMNRRLSRYLTYVGAIVVVFGMGKVHARFVGHYDFTGSSRFSWSIAYSALLCLVAYGTGIPDVVRRGAALAQAVAATFVATLAISVAQLVLGSAILPRFVVFLTPALLVPWYALCVGISTSARGRGGTRVLAVVGADEALCLEDDMARGNELRTCTVTVMAPEKASSDDAVEGPLLSAARESRASVLVLNRRALEDQHILAQAVHLHARGLRVRTLDRFYDEWLGKLPRHEVGQTSLLFDIGEVHRATYNRLKRIVDATVGIVAMPVLVVLTPAVLMVNVVANRGPLFYKQPRVGRHGSVFTILKFRTMSPGPSEGAWTESGDVRVTRFGRWLRMTHIDELPQVINILRGDLATVGPRPEQPHYVEELTASIPFYAARHLVRPGLTGWAQVNYRYGSSELDALEKLRYDLYYMQHQSLTLDLRILGRSIRNVMRGTGT